MSVAASAIHALSFPHGIDAHDRVEKLAFFATIASFWLSAAMLGVFSAELRVGIVAIVSRYAMGAGSFLVEFADIILVVSLLFACVSL